MRGLPLKTEPLLHCSKSIREDFMNVINEICDKFLKSNILACLKMMVVEEAWNNLPTIEFIPFGLFVLTHKFSYCSAADSADSWKNP